MRLFHLAWISFLIAAFGSSALALSPIVRTFQGVRASGMGNVRYTTGLYEENFYANPARTTENPRVFFQLPKFTFEAGANALSSMSAFLKAKGNLSGLSGAVGKPISARFQLLLPAQYRKAFLTPDWSLAWGMLATAQMVGQASQSGMVTPTTVLGGGPVVTIARRLLPEDRLSLGLTTHLEFRATSGNAFSVIDFLRGSVASSLRGGSGLGIDFDLGSSYRPHWGLGGFNYELGFAINNLLGGGYKNLGARIKGWAGDPTPTPTTFNFGISAQKEDFWKFSSFLLALEFTDFGNNTNGSIYKTIHMGAEAVWKKVSFRTGINQGYLCGGLGFNFRSFIMNLSTYGEELGLNVGTLEDRRYSLDFGFQI